MRTAQRRPASRRARMTVDAHDGLRSSRRRDGSPSTTEVSGDATPPSRSSRTPVDVPDAEPIDGLVPVPGARFAELPVGEIRPNPKQPRTVFDEDALEELVGSIREIGVLQPIVVRDAGDGYELIMGERRWRATQLAGLATDPRDHPGHRGLRPAARRAAGEPAPLAAEPAGGGGRVPAAARRLRVHARELATRIHAIAAADLQHAATAQAPAAGAATGRGRRAVGRARPRAARASATVQRSSVWRSASSPRACRSARSRRSCRWAATPSRRAPCGAACGREERGARPPRGTTLRPVRHAGQGRASASRGTSDGGVRVGAGPQPDPGEPRSGGPGSPQELTRTSRRG